MRIPTHPGTVLAEEIEARGISANRLALDLGVPASRIGEIIRGQRGVSPETALRLARCFGRSPTFWLNLQAAHDLGVAEQRYGDEIKRTVRTAA